MDSIELEKRLLKLEHDMATIKENIDKQEELIKNLTRAIEDLNHTLIMGKGMMKLISITGGLVLFIAGIYKVFKGV